MNPRSKGRPFKKPEKKFKKLSISLPPDVEAILSDKAWESGESRSEIITECLKKALLKADSKLQALPPAPPIVRRKNGGK